MKDKKYIPLTGKGFEKSNYIKRFFHLLEIIAPGKYELNTIHIHADVWDIKEQRCVLSFGANIIF